MLGIAGSTYALFALVWATMCVLAGVLVTDAMLHAAPTAVDVEQPVEDVAAEV